MEKIKTYVITLSRHFLANHKRAGEETHFKEKFLLGQGCPDCASPQDLSGINISDCNGCVRACSFPKLHTIRANYPLWEKRIKEVQEGRAALSIRQWTGKPYRSKQVEIAMLAAKNGVGVQKARIMPEANFLIAIDENYDKYLCTADEIEKIAQNDGLSIEDWQEWFRGYDLSKPMAIIHFTKFRY